MSWLDILPSSERAKIRKRMRSPAAYEKMRQSVKGPEDLEREMEKNASMAELKFALETEPVVHEVLRQEIERILKEEGIEKVLEIHAASRTGIDAINDGNFDVRIVLDDTGNGEQMVLHPEGNVQEKIPLKPAFSEKFYQ
jgi:hypothetical protein